MKPILEVKNLSCGYNKNPVLKNINFAIYENEIVGIVGPNASGKTTLAKTLLGIIKPLKGEIKKIKKDIRFGYVPQIFSIDETFPFSVYDILSFAFLSNFKFKLRIEEKQKIERIIRDFGLEKFKFSLYRCLSGGVKQKVLVCRNLLKDPNILILDEPTNDLDISNLKMFLEFLKRLKQTKNISIVLISHSLELVINYVERLFLTDGEKFEVLDNLEDVESIKLKVSDIFKINLEIIECKESKFIKL
ncbi:MAG: metal ABC transporter ATP-binding protein [Elusimicrobiota bacterium]|nr:metal ABC transporter ATP-binding protein [Endomicrobiia bacterium]MDW8165928.1 metal ABC transporter ATP-binding protein [Elusimicrobiota bacterium]